MTRREFIERLLTAGPAVIAGIYLLGRAIVPKRFTWADKAAFPGRIKKYYSASQDAKWSG